MKKKLFGTAIILFVVTLFCVSASAAEFTLKFANPVPQEHSWGRGADHFAKLVNEATNGRVVVQAYHAGSLGKIRETLEMAQAGTVDFVLAGTGHVTGHVPEMGITVLPYLWKDTETMFSSLDGPFGEFLNEKLLGQGFVLGAWWDNGFRHVSTKARPVVKPDDLKGVKIRSLPTKVHVDFFKALGASPTPMGWTELYQGLQQGVVDAQENPPAMVYMGKLHEVQKFYSLTAHVNEPGVVLMSKASLAKLPKDLQVAVKIALQKATLWQRKESDKDNQDVIKKLQSEGLTINEVPKETIEAFRKVAQTVYPDTLKTLGPGAKEIVETVAWFNR
jgi:tripartite ATP-independent transporter DctP family solute receptor